MDGPLPPLPPDSDDFSAATTIVPFPLPLPLLRGPIRATTSDDPSCGPYLLAFKNVNSWAVAYNSCKAQITSQCESGARIGCSISASNKCKPPWWKLLLGQQDLSERAKCEEIEMNVCCAAARQRCAEFAKQKCVPAFKNARIQVSGSDLGVLEQKEAFTLISMACFMNRRGKEIWPFGLNKSWDEFRSKFSVTNVRGCQLLSSADEDIEDYLTKIS
ncbi:hypothetical protein F511_02047 [Dorcoceras hygrometricum]|uniref:Uncharacterized protein n=1 Tax=Dorcoceras hygrometricum TaxID=472368 RepID=A0A2Z7BYV3_9LAMI|nr:hypothetical protein F511_02047 [Dorcoceras hygrometricum]